MMKSGLAIPVLYMLIRLCYGLFGNGAEFVTMPAVCGEVGSGVTVSGFVVREEMTLPPVFLPTTLCISEGEWVSAGQTIAYGFEQEGDASRERQRQRLLAERSALVSSLQGAEDAMLAYAQGQLSEAELKAAVIRADSSAAAVQQAICRLDSTIEELTVPPAAEITAPCAGYYYVHTDGWEDQLNRQALQTMPELTEPEPKPTSGKLIVANEWYYVANVPSWQVKGSCNGDLVTVALMADVPRLTMRIEAIRDEPGGNSVLILKSDRELNRVAELRSVRAELGLNVQRGLRIAKQALWLDEEGVTGVYVLQGAQAVWKQVCLIADGGDYYLVRQNDADGLRVGDPVILTDEALHNGKVIDP